jgi:hypothetical protein
MDSEKIAAVANWGLCVNLHDARAFLSFVNFYRRFIRGYSKLVALIVRLTRKNVKFEWGSDCQRAMNELKRVFTTASILTYFDSNRESLMKANALNYVSTKILFQRNDIEILYLVIFFSKKHSSTKYNYEIYDKKLMTIVRCFEK